MIVSNQATCAKCGEEIFSATRHDFKRCHCGAIAVDGGMAYIRRVGVPANIIEQSIVITDEQADLLLEALEWCDDTGRNNIGRLCAVMRGMRDLGLLDHEETKS